MNTLHPARYPDETQEMYKARRAIANKYKPPVTYVHQHEIRFNEQDMPILVKTTYRKPEED